MREDIYSITLRAFMTLAIIILLVFFLGSLRSYSVIVHEEAHKAIFNLYSVQSTIEYKYLANAEWTTLIVSGKTKVMQGYEKCNDTCKTSQSQNEILSYHFDLFFYLVFFILLFYVLMKIWFMPIINDWEKKHGAKNR